MPKRKKQYTDQISFLAAPGTLSQLEAIGYFRGRKGRKGVAAREMFERGLQSFLDSLGQTDARRYKDILASVQLSATLQRDDSLS